MGKRVFGHGKGGGGGLYSVNVQKISDMEEGGAKGVWAMAMGMGSGGRWCGWWVGVSVRVDFRWKTCDLTESSPIHFLRL